MKILIGLTVYLVCSGLFVWTFLWTRRRAFRWQEKLFRRWEAKKR